jgi:hypothetical protein
MRAQEHADKSNHTFDTPIIPAMEQFTKGIALWNGQLDPACVAAYSKQVRVPSSSSPSGASS